MTWRDRAGRRPRVSGRAEVRVGGARLAGARAAWPRGWLVLLILLRAGPVGPAAEQPVGRAAAPRLGRGLIGRLGAAGRRLGATGGGLGRLGATGGGLGRRGEVGCEAGDGLSVARVGRAPVRLAVLRGGAG